MELYNLPKITTKTKRRLGQGHGSGRVKTAGRGTKGQNARGKMPLYFEGGALPLIKRLPFRRGKNRNNVFKKKPVIINVKALNLLPRGTVMSLEALVKHNIVKALDAKVGVKILGDGELTTSLNVSVPTSKQAAQKIEKAGGTVTR